MKKYLIPINGEKLKVALKKRNLKRSVVSEEMGLSRCYIQSAINRNTISRSSIILLEKLFGIKFEEYSDGEQEKTESQPKVDYDDLYNFILRAVKDALQGGAK